MAELILSSSGSPPLSLSSANQTSSNGDLVIEWPEPIQRVQELAESGMESLPERYARAPGAISSDPVLAPIPVVDLSTIFIGNDTLCMQTLSSACRQWGVFQVVNHGVSEELLSATMATSRSFFSLDKEKKLKYANNPVTYEGYGSRMGVQKGIKLDWNDYFFHHLQPLSDQEKWPTEPVEYHEVIREYGEKVVELCKRLLSIFSDDLCLPENTLLNCFGGDDGIAACYRMNYYPKCPQPELALGLSPHSDPGGFTVVLQDSVAGLQVNKEGKWYTVAPVENALVIIIGDQLEILTNGVYKSADHRTTTNNEKERMTLVVFFNPNGEQKIRPMEEVVGRSGGRRRYEEMSFNEYRKLIRTFGVQGKAILSSRALKCPKEEETKCAEEEEEVLIEP